MLALLFFSFIATAQVGENFKVDRFYTHLTTPARTIDQARITFETFPGANGQTSFAVNSLSVGILNWLQIGVVPLFYIYVPDHRWNANVKVNIIREKYFQLGLGYSRFSIKLGDPDTIYEKDGSRTENPRADISFMFIALNYREPSNPWAYGVNIAHLEPTSNSPLVEETLKSQARRKEDWALDVSYDINKTWTVTGGMGESRVNVFELHSPRGFGYGASMSYKRDTKWFTRFTGGLHYMPSEHRLGTMISFDL